MSKIFTVRECLDIEDAARRLTGSLVEEVTPKDVLNLVMEGKIPISVRFKFPVTVRQAKIHDSLPEGRWGIDFLYVGSEEKKYLTLHGDQQTLEGVVDLASVGSYMRNLVSSQAWNGVLDSDVSAEDLLLRNGDGDLVALVGVLTEGLRHDAGKEWGEFSYSFPEDSQLVIRTSAIRVFEESLAIPVLTSDVGIKERSTLFNVGQINETFAVLKENTEPEELPEELDAANIAFRAVRNGYGERSATPKNRLIDYLKKNYVNFNNDTVKRVAAVANPDKGRGRKKFLAE